MSRTTASIFAFSIAGTATFRRRRTLEPTTSIARSTSSAVVVCPSVIRRAPAARERSTPIAASTCDGSIAPLAHAEAYAAGELKHGPLALISPDVPTVAIVPNDELTGRNIAALHEIAARGGPLVVITHADVDLGEIECRRIDVPRSVRELDPILLTIPLQLLAYRAALHLGLDIDKPRNLAKSVTVE